MQREIASLPWRKRLEFRLSTILGWAFITLLGSSYRYRFEGAEHLRKLEQEGKPCLLAIWHGRFFVFVYLFRFRGFVALVSQHLDGEMIAQTLHRLRFKTVRGSSTRGGKEAFHNMVEALRRGESGVVIPDGPRGPRHKLKPGVIYMALKTGVPILPLTYSARPAVRFKSWDHFMLPLPFAKVVVKIGRPFYVPADADDRKLVGLKNQLERTMVDQEREADAIFHS